MKRFALYLGLATALVASCSTHEKDFQTPVQEDAVFYVITFEQPVEEGTRVYANEDLLLRWTADDRVSIFNKTTRNYQYKFTGNTGDNSGEFSLVAGGGSTSGSTVSHVISVYPYKESTSLSENEILTLLLPSMQAYAQRSFGLGANTMVSVSSDNLLQFKNVCGFLRLRLRGEGISVSSITLPGNNDEKIAGPATITLSSDGTPSVTMSDDATTEITLTCDIPVELGASTEESTEFWFAVPPVTFSKGFTITVNHAAGTFEKSTSKSISITRNTLSGMSPLAADIITFEDNLVKSLLVEYFDPDGDGEISLSEASAVTTFDVHTRAQGSSIFKGAGVHRFDEMVYFTGLSEIAPNTFENCTALESIVIPETVTHLGDRAFYGCSNLKSVTMMSPTPPTLGVEVFGKAPNLKIVVPEESVDVYREAWDEYAGHIVVPGNIIVFRDSAVKAICVSNWDTDGDGELSYEEAATVSYLGSFTFSNPSIASFDEFQFFKGLASIEDWAFAECSSLTSITLPENIRQIGRYSFYGCSSLTDINMPESLSSINESAFFGCNSLVSIDIPNVRTIGEYAFCDCSSLVNVVLPDYLDIIESGTFFGCSSLTDMDIPCVKTIGDYAFSGCSSLVDIGIIDRIQVIGEGAFSDCSSLIRFDLPSTISGIGSYAFSGCSKLRDFNFLYVNDSEENLAIIDNGVFSGCSSLYDIILPESVTSIGEEAFKGSGIWNIDMPNVDSIGQGAFMDCTNLYRIVLLNSLECIDNNTFSGCGNLKRVEIPRGVTRIGENAFANCISLSEVVIPGNVDSIENEAFSGCSNLAEIVISDGVTTIGSRAFADCISLSKIVIPGSVSWVGNLFDGCSSLTSVTMHDGVTEIGRSAFGGCIGLTTVDIPASVERIGIGAFQGCESLARVNITSLESWCQIDFDPGWVGTNPLEYAHHLFLNGSDLTELIIPDGVTRIGAGVFGGCNSLSAVTIPESVQSIGEKAFVGCDGLTRVNISDLASWCSISFQEEYSNPLWYAEHLYLNGAELETIVFPDGMTSVKDYTFINMNSLSGVQIPEGVTSIGRMAFFDCDNLVDVHLPDSLIDICQEAFCYCYTLPGIVIPKNVTSIGTAAFLDCRSLTNVTVLPEMPPSVGWGIFEYADNAYYFVPAESVEAYKSAPYWSNLAGRIQAIPE